MNNASLFAFSPCFRIFFSALSFLSSVCTLPLFRLFYGQFFLSLFALSPFPPIQWHDYLIFMFLLSPVSTSFFFCPGVSFFSVRTLHFFPPLSWGEFHYAVCVFPLFYLCYGVYLPFVCGFPRFPPLFLAAVSFLCPHFPLFSATFTACGSSLCLRFPPVSTFFVAAVSFLWPHFPLFHFFSGQVSSRYSRLPPFPLLLRHEYLLFVCAFPRFLHLFVLAEFLLSVCIFHPPHPFSCFIA